LLRYRLASLKTCINYQKERIMIIGKLEGDMMSEKEE
jgi:hypothetical protein